MTGRRTSIQHEQPMNERRCHLNGHNHQPTGNERLASRRINASIEQAQTSGQPIDDEAARLIAAAIHSGGDLEVFAATGRLDAARTRSELHRVGVAGDQALWLRALGEFLWRADQPQARVASQCPTEETLKCFME
jgi:hypothetical protein